MKSIIPLVTVGALLWLAPHAALAAASPVQTVTIPYADLDLSGQAGANALDRRIGHAVRLLCGTASATDLKERNAVRRCRSEIRTLAAAQRDRIVEAARRQAAFAPGAR